MPYSRKQPDSSMTEKTYTHKDLAALLGVSETTVKSYRRKFPGCIPVANRGKPIRFTEAAAKVAIRIRDLFETGMSVEEVRARLSQEFDWISPDTSTEREAKGPVAKRVSRTSGKVHEVGPELSIGVSNMAKSMVALTQQQKAIMSKLERVEAMLSDLGLKDANGLASLLGKNVASTQNRDVRIEQQLSLLGGALKDLSTGLLNINRRLDAVTSGQSEHPLPKANTPGKQTTVTEPPKPSVDHAWDESVEALPSAVTKPKNSAVIKFRPGPAPSAPQQEKNSSPGEPSRDFLALPIVVRTQAGRYVSAGGRGRGRFSIADLKALLSHAVPLSKRVSMHWEAHGQGWWLFLDQGEGGSIKLLLMELPTQKSGNVVEILKLRDNDQEMHPAEFAALLERFSV